MKKNIVLVFIAVLIAFGITSCKDNKNKDILKVGIDLKYPPFMYMDNNNNPSGLEVDIAYALGKYINKEVEIVNTDFSMLIPSLETGEIDIIISDMSINKERKQKVDFTKGYRYSKTAALINKDFYIKNKISDSMTVKEFFNLPNIKCVGLSGTIGTSIPQKYNVSVNEASEIATALMEINSGESNVLIGTYAVYQDHHKNKEKTMIYEGIQDYTTSAFAVKKGNTELLDQANAFIKTLYKKGGLYEQLANKYDTKIGEIFYNKDYTLNYITTKPKS